MMRRIAGLLFVITGASALLAEQAFEKLLEPLLGTTVHAASAVLAIYFAGLTIGAWAHRFVRRRSTPIRTYAVLEAGIGGWALLLYVLFEHLTAAFVPLLRTVADNFAALETARLLVASIWILPPTILMGATFPAMVDFLSTQPDSRRAISSFYALNLLGAMIAAGAAPYFIFATVGLDKALLVAAALDLSVAIAAALLASGAVRPVDDSISQHAGPRPDRRRVLALVFAAGCSGFLFFALEVVWTHLIAAVCGNSVYAFAAMLFAVLTGLFIGSAIASRIAPAGSDVAVAVPAFAIILGAGLLVAQQILWPHVPHAFTIAGPHVHSFAAAELVRTGVTFALIVPVAILLGGVLPLLFRLRDFPLDAEATTAGAMTAANAIGCCAGALLAAFVLIPVAGSEASLLAIAIAYAAVGVAVLVLSSARTRVVGLACVAVTVAISGLAPRWDRLQLTSGENVYFAPGFVTPATKLLFFHEDAAGGITTVIQSPRGDLKTLLTNGKFQGSNGGEVMAQVGLSVVPEMYCSHFDDALVIGFGTGQSAEVTNAMGFRRIDIAEIAPGILAASDEWFPDLNGHVMEKPNVRTFVEDGRNVLQLRDKRYDVIIMEISSIWFAGATNLYSREFYRTAAARLQPGGVLQQWVQLHHTTPRELASTLATARSAFARVTLWIIGGQGIVVASQSPQILRAEGIARALRILGPAGMRDLLRRRALGDADCDRVIAGIGAPLNTDRNRWIEYRSPRYNVNPPYQVNDNIAALREFARPSPLIAEPAARSLLHAIVAR